MKRRIQGLSLLELLIVITVVGILFSIGFISFPRDRIEVNQALQEVARTVERARFESVEENRFVWLEFDAAAQVIEVRSQPSAVDETDSRQIARLAYGSGDRARLGFEVDVASPAAILFDSRGVGHGIVSAGTYLNDGEFTLTLRHSGTDFDRSIAINKYGRTVER